jgi:lysophospholipid acyltransferase
MRVLSRQRLPEVMFIFNMAYLSSFHIYYMITAYGDWTLNPTSMLMPLVCRLSSLGYCYRDASKKNEDKISLEQRERKIDQLPTMLELFSYACFPGGAICGPFFEFSDYKLFIEKKGRYESIPYHREQPIKYLLSAICFMVLSLVVPNFYSVEHCGSKEFKEYGFLYKNFYYYIGMAGNRYKYYTAFYFSDFNVCISGLSYNGRDDNARPKWDRIE